MRIPRSLLRCLLALFVLLGCATGARAAEQERVLRFLPPDRPVAGYHVHLRWEAQQQTLDLRLPPLDADGVGSAVLVLDSATDYEIFMTSYDAQGVESTPSNALRVEAVSCDPSTCDDRNPCTADACGEAACTSRLVPDGTLCGADARDPAVCSAGRCQAVDCLIDADCRDVDVCDGGSVCQAFRCQLTLPPTCPAQTQCRDAGCAATGGCWTRDRADGTSCDDGLSSTVADRCTAGECAGVVPLPDPMPLPVIEPAPVCRRDAECGRSTQCARSVCDAVKGCLTKLATDGARCNDGQRRTLGDHCESGLCVGKTSRQIQLERSARQQKKRRR